MRKQWLCTLLALVLIVPSLWVSTAQAKSSADFEDLNDLDAETKAKFDAMIEAGVFNGVADGQFGLKDEMNRAQFAKVASLIFGLEVDYTLSTSTFSDVDADGPGGYALPYIEAIKAAGITDGMGDGRFDPTGNVTRQQFATFLVRGLGVDDEAKDTPGVDDPTVSDWAKGYVALALELKLLTNGADGTFGGHNHVDRKALVLTAYDTKQVVDEMKQAAEEQQDEEGQEEDEEKEQSPYTSPSTSSPSDRTAPILASGYPKLGEIQPDGSKQAQILVQANERGTAYYVVVGHGDPAPSAAQVIAGQSSIGQAALAASSAALTANAELALLTAALPADAAAYDAYVVVRDSAGNASAPAYVSFETPSAPLPTVEMPVAYHAFDTVAEATYVTLTSPTLDAKIYYTVDGSEPTTDSPEYSERIYIIQTVVIKAFAVKDGMHSEVMSGIFDILAPGGPVIPGGPGDPGLPPGVPGGPDDPGLPG